MEALNRSLWITSANLWSPGKIATNHTSYFLKYFCVLWQESFFPQKDLVSFINLQRSIFYCDYSFNLWIPRSLKWHKCGIGFVLSFMLKPFGVCQKYEKKYIKLIYTCRMLSSWVTNSFLNTNPQFSYVVQTAILNTLVSFNNLPCLYYLLKPQLVFSGCCARLHHKIFTMELYSLTYE